MIEKVCVCEVPELAIVPPSVAGEPVAKNAVAPAPLASLPLGALPVTVIHVGFAVAP